MDIHLEFERKWRLKTVPKVPFSRELAIRQGYLDQDGQWARIRETRLPDGVFTHVLCRKIRKSVGPLEMETDISADAFLLLWPLCSKACVVKTRLEWTDTAGKLWEIDVYGGTLDGLITLELEMDAPEDLVEFPPEIAACLDRELTGDSAWSNHNLARRGRPDADHG